MKILDRYIIRQLVPPFIYCILCFLFLYIILDLFGHIDEILREKIALAVLIRYYLSFIPLIFVQTSPVASLLSTLYVLSSLNKHNEIIAMKASGRNLFRIIVPFLTLGIIVSILSFLVNDKVVPSSSLVSSTVKEEEIEKKISQKTEVLSDVTFYGAGNRLFYIKSYDVAKSSLNDIIILQHDQQNVVRSKIIAREARWEENAWNFYDVTIYRLDEAGQVIEKPITYGKKRIEVKEQPKDFQRRQREPMFMSFGELKNYILKFGQLNPEIVRKLSVDLYSKVSFPFANLVIILIGIPFALGSSRMKAGLLKEIGVSVAIGFIYYCLMAISCALGKAAILPTFLSAWLANIIFGACGIILVGRIK